MNYATINSTKGGSMNFILFILYSCILILAFNQVDNYWFDLIASLRGQMLAFSLLFAMACVHKAKKLGAVCVVLSTVLIFHHYNYFNQADSQPGDIKIAQANVHYSNPYLTDIINTQLVNSDNDILILFEFNDKQRHLLSELKGRYHLFGYAEVEGAPFGIIVISKHPIIQKQIRYLGNPKLGFVQLNFLFKDTVVSTILLHPPSPRNQLLWEQRNYLLSKVDQQMLQLKGHWFIAGDFNTVPWSRYFLNHNYSCSQQGRNYASWSAVENKLAISLVGLPIDNCIVSQGTRLSGVHTQVIKGSDHHLLSYQLSFSTY